MVVVLFTSTMTSQQAECTAVVTFRGATDSATASAATREEAETQARNTACGTISSGMNDRIACGRDRIGDGAWFAPIGTIGHSGSPRRVIA